MRFNPILIKMWKKAMYKVVKNSFISQLHYFREIENLFWIGITCSICPLPLEFTWEWVGDDSPYILQILKSPLLCLPKIPKVGKNNTVLYSAYIWHIEGHLAIWNISWINILFFL